MSAMYDPCYTCRRRRIQCDRTSIPCAKCEKSGLECFEKRPLRWVNGVAFRGKMQGVLFEDVSSTAVAKVETTSVRTGRAPIKSSVKRLEPMTVSHIERNDAFDGPPLSLPLVLEDHSVSMLDRTSRYYLDYYNERICNLFIVYDSDKNPFRSLISLALSDSILLKAILALAARHHANTGRSFHQSVAATSPGLHRDALFFKHQAMKGLVHALNDTTLCRQDTTVASIFLLIFLDLLESGSDKWNLHLEGAKTLIALNQPPSESQAAIKQDPGRTVQQIRTFITRQIYLIETLGATFVRPRLLSQFISPDRSGMPLQEIVEESFLGCPEYLLNAIQYISLQRDVIAGLEPLDYAAINYHIQDITTVLESIQNFDCYIWASSLPQPHQSLKRDINNLCILSQSYKTGALIYGRRVLDALTKDVTSQDGLVCELIGLIGTLKDDKSLLKCILWPIFVAGLECRCIAERDFLTGCLEKFWVDTNCLNVINAARILQTYWQQGDRQQPFSSQWIFSIGRLGRDWLLI
ncbi:fungal-specific transcription factor domain-containing protein [Lipomyces chichibuensis]|uniref:fungal-specific transcription factor domain-containing protein n=1 Tax=Lipomyces chichibuensis TaxID=1546026 RepID=UPI003343746E